MKNILTLLNDRISDGELSRALGYPVMNISVVFVNDTQSEVLFGGDDARAHRSLHSGRHPVHHDSRHVYARVGRVPPRASHWLQYRVH